jgi:glycosyltransferase involved in cell wall biosynthesis
MKLLYLTNVQIPAADAQNLQVQSMCKAFFYSLNNDFLLISPWSSVNEKMSSAYRWERIEIIKWLPRSLRQLSFIFKSRTIVRNFQPDVIYTRDIAIAWFFERLGFKTIYEIHRPFITKIGNVIFKRICKKIKIVVISQALKDFIINQYNLNSDMILVAHDGVDLKNFNILENKEQLREKYFSEIKDKFIVLYTGSQERGKGVEMIINAASKLRDLIFVVIGSQEDKKIDNLIFKKRKSHEEIPKYLKAADLLVLPMNKELSYSAYSSPLKLFEYMASETPILTSKIGAISEILNEKNSFLFNPGRKDDFEEKILYVKKNRLEAEITTRETLRGVKNYTWENRVMSILKFINGISNIIQRNNH